MKKRSLLSIVLVFLLVISSLFACTSSQSSSSSQDSSESVVLPDGEQSSDNSSNNDSSSEDSTDSSTSDSSDNSSDDSSNDNNDDNAQDNAPIYISFMGDSITTYQNYSNNTKFNTTIGNNSVWYTSNKLDSVEKTWWKRTCNELGLALCVNNSWSGSRVSITRDEVSASSMSRAYNLHNDNEAIEPNIIVIFIGINDVYNNVQLGSFNGIADIYCADEEKYIGNLNEFSQAYATMVYKIISKYKNADIYCCTLFDTGVKPIEQFNNAIKNIAEYFEVKVVDFYNETNITGNNISTYTIDNLHPNELGMIELSECLINHLLKYYN